MCDVAWTKPKEGLYREGLGGLLFPFPACAKDKPGGGSSTGAGLEWEAKWGDMGSSNDPPPLDEQPKDQKSWERVIF